QVDIKNRRAFRASADQMTFPGFIKKRLWVHDLQSSHSMIGEAPVQQGYKALQNQFSHLAGAHRVLAWMRQVSGAISIVKRLLNSAFKISCLMAHSCGEPQHHGDRSKSS